MRIQHNIMAMNAYRNLGMNNSQLSKNLEKLSSGYRINRAGDDAAGLAISEKMRAQIAGLDQAQKNAQSGINMVQTAEGALTEVHDMLNRMVTLATQAANGTYSETDREKIQAEINALTDEIDRIADNSNFNGTKLLDGSLTEGNVAGGIAFTDTKAVAGVTNAAAFTALVAPQKAGDTLSYTVAWSEGGVEHTKTVSFEVGDTTTELYVLDENGNKTDTKYTITATAKNTELQAAVEGELKKDANFVAAFDMASTKTSGACFAFTSKTAGSAGAEITALGLSGTMGATGGAILSTGSVQAKDSMQKVDLSKLTVLTGATAIKAEDVEKAVFEIQGQKFALVDGTLTSSKTTLKNVPADVHMITLVNKAYKGSDDADKVAAELTRITGQKFEKITTTDPTAGLAENDIVYKGEGVLSAAGKGLTLQIGSDAVETINVAVDSMKADALGIKGLDIGDPDKANAAIQTIKDAIEKVSVTRGDLGAVQNRLEHTINNLGVMEENIQDAEANIRDTDIADQMMAYTKNNILIQSAQAMLAQANQVPQGVLQLMQ